MTRWVPERNDVMAALAEEIAHNYGKGRVAIGVDGRVSSHPSEFADRLAVSLGAAGHDVVRLSADGVGPEATASAIAGFRSAADNGSGSMLLVDGTGLQSPGLAGMWNYALWLENGSTGQQADDEYVTRVKPSAAANAVVDNSDEEHPRRLFADSC